MSQSFSFLQITDHHLGPSETSVRYGYAVNYTFRQTLQHLIFPAAKSDFVISTGDLVDPPTPQGYARLLRTLGIVAPDGAFPGPLKTSYPGLEHLSLYLMPGNHDDRAQLCQSVFPQTQPSRSLSAAFEHRGVLFMCLDWGQHDQGRLYSEIEEILQAGLSRGLPTIIFSHHQLVPIGMHWMDAMLPDEAGWFWQAVQAAGRQVLGVISGHTHLNYEQHIGGIPVWGLGSTSYSFTRSDKPQALADRPYFRRFQIENGELQAQLFEVPLPVMDEADFEEETHER